MCRCLSVGGGSVAVAMQAAGFRKSRRGTGCGAWYRRCCRRRRGFVFLTTAAAMAIPLEWPATTHTHTHTHTHCRCLVAASSACGSAEGPASQQGASAGPRKKPALSVVVPQQQPRRRLGTCCPRAASDITTRCRLVSTSSFTLLFLAFDGPQRKELRRRRRRGIEELLGRLHSSTARGCRPPNAARMPHATTATRCNAAVAALTAACLLRQPQRMRAARY